MRTKAKCGAGILFVVNKTSKLILGRSNKGELEIPGGRKEQKDMTLIHTAIRETSEEIGFDPKMCYTLLKFVNKNKYCSSLFHCNGSYVTYIVKVDSFNIEKANLAAQNRIKNYKQLSDCDKKLLRPLIEMDSYVEVELKQLLKRLNDLRSRDRYFMKNEHFLRTLQHVINNGSSFSGKFNYLHFEDF
jgi:8-oxo-dGTP pyrophosphatase MutT (NUDIX family)